MQVKKPRDKLYVTFMSMKSRCNSLTCKDYKYYGGRGISISPKWSTFAAFKEWAEAHGYSPGLTLDRKKTAGNYEPGNCRWASRRTQVRNRNSFKGGSSPYIGVSWNAQYSKWTATVCVNHKNTHVGRFEDEESAARARDAFVIQQGLTEYTLNFN